MNWRSSIHRENSLEKIRNFATQKCFFFFFNFLKKSHFYYTRESFSERVSIWVCSPDKSSSVIDSSLSSRARNYKELRLAFKPSDELSGSSHVRRRWVSLWTLELLSRSSFSSPWGYSRSSLNFSPVVVGLFRRWSVCDSGWLGFAHLQGWLRRRRCSQGRFPFRKFHFFLLLETSS